MSDAGRRLEESARSTSWRGTRSKEKEEEACACSSAVQLRCLPGPGRGSVGGASTARESVPHKEAAETGTGAATGRVVVPRIPVP